MTIFDQKSNLQYTVFLLDGSLSDSAKYYMHHENMPI